MNDLVLAAGCAFASLRCATAQHAIVTVSLPRIGVTLKQQSHLRHRSVRDPAGQPNGELRRPEHVHQARPVRQRLARRRAPDECPLSRLGHAEVAGVQDAEPDLRVRKAS